MVVLSQTWGTNFYILKIKEISIINKILDIYDKNVYKPKSKSINILKKISIPFTKRGKSSVSVMI